jgi:hypothetical protein
MRRPSTEEWVPTTELLARFLPLLQTSLPDVLIHRMTVRLFRERDKLVIDLYLRF